MSIKASVNYHVHADTAQAYHIDAGGVVGKIISPELVATNVSVGDMRAPGEVLCFEGDSVTFAESASRITDFENGSDWQDVYNQELTDLLQKKIGAQSVFIFDHTVRVDDPASGRKPARNVHSDYSPTGAEQRLRDLVGTDKAAEWQCGHYGFVNVWRPIENPIESAPLGFVRPRSVQPQDWMTIGLIYPDRIGEIMGLAANTAHEWVYMSKMTPDEVAIFNIYDNRGRPSIGHSALDINVAGSAIKPRKSIESRTLVRY